MKIYQSEIDDGLEELIKNRVVAYTAAYKLVDLELEKKKILKSLAANRFNANPDQFDLLYIEDILASTGMNENDDIFISSELVKARNTPVDKPFNFMHNESFIIGHITGSRLVDRDGNEIDLSNPDNIPIDLDLITGSVIYKHYENEEKAKFIGEMIDKILNSEYFVSMECLFDHFDYGLVDIAGNQRIIARNKTTAFLTKRLRIYGGTGEYDGCRIGRVLRDYTFSGKGLVDNPANKRSDILAVANKQELEVMTKVENAVATTVGELLPTVLKSEYDALKAEFTEMKKAVAANVTSEIEGYKKTIASLETDASNVAKLSEEKDNKIAELEKSISDVTAAKQALEAELNSLKTEQVKASRVASLLQVGVEKVRAEELVTKFSTASDEQFGEVIKMNTKKSDASTTVTQTTENVTIASVKADQDAALVEPEIDTANKTRTSAASWFATLLTKPEANKTK